MIFRSNIIYENRVWGGNIRVCGLFWSVNWGDDRMGSDIWNDIVFPV